MKYAAPATAIEKPSLFYLSKGKKMKVKPYIYLAAREKKKVEPVEIIRAWAV